MRSFKPLADEIEFLILGFDSLLRLLLEGVQHPNVIPDLQSVDRPIRIGSVLQGHLIHAGSETLHRLGEVVLAAFGRSRQHSQNLVSCTFRL